MPTSVVSEDAIFDALIGILPLFTTVTGDVSTSGRLVNVLVQAANTIVPTALLAKFGQKPAAIAGMLTNGLGVETGRVAFDEDLTAKSPDPYVLISDLLTIVADFVGFNGSFLALLSPSGSNAGSFVQIGADVISLKAAQISLSDPKAAENIRNSYPIQTLQKALASATHGIEAGVASTEVALQGLGGTINHDFGVIKSALFAVLNEIAQLSASVGTDSFLSQASAVDSGLAQLANAVTQFLAGDITNPAITPVSGSDQTNALAAFENGYLQAGYYLVQAGDTFQSIAAAVDQRPGISVDAATLGRLETDLGVSALTTGEPIATPLFADQFAPGSGVSLTPLPADQTYLFDAASDTLYTVGAAVDGGNSGALIVGSANGGPLVTFDAGTISDIIVTQQGLIEVFLETPWGEQLGILTFDGSSGAAVLKLFDGTTVNGSVAGAHFTDPPQTPDAILVSYLADLGLSLTAQGLDQDNFNHLNPSAQPFIVDSSEVDPNGNNTAANVIFSVSQPGAVVAGQPMVAITVFDPVAGHDVQQLVPATNILQASGDLSEDQISGIDELQIVGAVSLTQAEFASFALITGGGTLTATTAGTFDLTNKNAGVSALFATDFGATTLIGNDIAAQTLVASELGNDTLIAGNGANDQLEAGYGDDTLIGGSGGDAFTFGNGVDTVHGGAGNDTFILAASPPAGSTLVGGGGTDTLESEVASGVDITGMSISGVQRLNGDSIAMTVVQLEGFTSFSGGAYIIEDTAANIENGLAAIAAQASRISSIAPTDTDVALSVAAVLANQDLLEAFGGELVLQDTAANIVAAIPALAQVLPPFELADILSTDSVIGVPVSIVEDTGDQALLSKIGGGFAISDTAANVEAGLSQILEYQLNQTSALASIQSTSGAVAVSVSEALAYQSVLDLVTTGVTVTDRAVDVATELPALQDMVAGGLVQSITLTDGGVPILHITGAEAVQDAQALGAIAGAYTLQLDGPAAQPSDFDATGASDLLIENTAGAVVVGQVESGAVSFATDSGLGHEWSFRGEGGLLDDGRAGFLIENASGVVVVGEVKGGQVVFDSIASLGPEWSFKGVGDFLGRHYDQFLIENTSGAVVVGDANGGAVQYTTVSGLGPEWSFVGSGDFLGDGKDDFLIENSAGAVVVGDVTNGSAVFTQVTGLGSEWKFVGSGDYLGEGHDQFLIENTAGAVDVGDYVEGQIEFTQVAGLGPEWKFVADGDYLGEGHDQFLIENSSGAVVIGDWTGGAIHFTQVAALGPEWAFH